MFKMPEHSFGIGPTVIRGGERAFPGSPDVLPAAGWIWVQEAGFRTVLRPRSRVPIRSAPRIHRQFHRPRCADPHCQKERNPMFIRALSLLSVFAPAGLAAVGPQAAAIVVAAPGGYLGVRASSSDDGKVVVDEVVAGSPAEKSGLKAGDVVVSIDESPIGSVDGLLTLLGGKNAGDRVTVKLKRGAETISAVVNLAQRPLNLDTTQAPAAPPVESMPVPSSPAEDAQPAQRGWLGIYYADAPDGVAIESVVDGGPAQQAGLAAGDVLTSVGKTQVGNSADLISVLEDLRAGDTLTFKVKRGAETLDVAVTLGSRVDAAAPRTSGMDEAPAAPAAPATPAEPSMDEPTAGQRAPAARMNRARRAVGRVASAQVAEKGPGLTLAPGQELRLRAVHNEDGTLGVEVVSGKEVHQLKVPAKGTRGFTIERDGDNVVLRMANIPTVQPLRVRVGGQGKGLGGQTPPAAPSEDDTPPMGGGGMALFAPGSSEDLSALEDHIDAIVARAAPMAATVDAAGGKDDADESEADDDELDADDAPFVVTTDGATMMFETTDDGVTVIEPADEGKSRWNVIKSSDDGEGSIEFFVAQAGDDDSPKPRVERLKIAGTKAKDGAKAKRAKVERKAAKKPKKAAQQGADESPKHPAKRAFMFRGPAGGELRGFVVPGTPAMPRMPGMEGPRGGMRAFGVPLLRGQWRQKMPGERGDAPAVPGVPLLPRMHAAPRQADGPRPHPRVIIEGDRILIFDRGHGPDAPAHDVVVEGMPANECARRMLRRGRVL
jgi:hypothetical protein